ncbi:MAG: methyltransferase domain-containing protein [Anaerolineales bacterium]|nr:methyltransferase domain-containing protein [Anaerolineales bacterium]
MERFVFVCPVCGGELHPQTAAVLICPQDNLRFCCKEGIWRFLPPARQDALAQFLQEYETVRRAEGRGRDDAAYYRALPFVSGTVDGWEIRAQSYQTLLQGVIEPLEASQKRPLKILDLGAGNCWLSYRLAQRGHLVAAVDLLVNGWDGLGAQRYYEIDFTTVQAEFDQLPLAPEQADLTIFNASFHYTVDAAATLTAVKQVVRPDGVIVIMDTAVYREPSSGRQMVQEREQAYRANYGFPSNALASENFLTFARVAELRAQTGIEWEIVWPVPRWRRLVRQLKVAVRRQREAAQFPLLVGRRVDG